MAKNMNDFKPVRIGLEIIFDADNRRVVPADLEKATRAAIVAVRTSLEGSSPSYKIKDIEATVEYLYVQVKKVIPVAARRLAKSRSRATIRKVV